MIATSPARSPVLPALAQLHVYRRALDLAASVHSLGVAGSLGDQMKRAAQSLVLNPAEGAGETSRASKRRYYAIARASAWELAAALDLAAIAGVRPGDVLAPELTAVERILGALVRK